MLQCPSKSASPLVQQDLDVTCDTLGKITHISPGLARLLGYDPADLSGRNLFILFPPRAVPAFLDAFSMAYLMGGFRGEMEMVRADGVCFAAQLHFGPSKRVAGKTTHLVCSVETHSALTPA